MDWIIGFIFLLIKLLVILVGLLLVAAYLVLVERKFLARLQIRNFCRAGADHHDHQRNRAPLAIEISDRQWDPLTGLLNRRGFEKELSRVLATARRYDEQGVLIYLDLDDFKRVNDNYGHSAGDEMLKQVACFLDKSVRRSDYVARLGGDEFAILLIKISDMNGILRAEIMNRRLNREVQTVFLMTGLRWIFTSSSIIKEAIQFGGNIDGMVPDLVQEKLVQKFNLDSGSGHSGEN